MPKVDTMVRRPLGCTWKRMCLPCWKGAKTDSSVRLVSLQSDFLFTIKGSNRFWAIAKGGFSQKKRLWKSHFKKNGKGVQLCFSRKKVGEDS